MLGIFGEDSFAYCGQIEALKATVEDNQLKVEQSIAKLKTIIDETVTDVQETLRIKKSDNPLEVNEDWHAEATQEALYSVEKLQSFVQDEVYLQFAHHFSKLSKLKEIK